MPTEAAKKNPWTTPTWIVIAMASVVWWIIASQHLWWRLVLVIGLSLASFMVGCLVGFLFTSYGEESGTVGKIRDWVIGGITGLTIAKAGNQRPAAYFRRRTRPERIRAYCQFRRLVCGARFLL